MQITNQPTTIRTTEDKVSIAAQFLFARWDKESQSCVYRDDSTRKNYRCDSESEMIDLYDLMHSRDSDVRRDAYSHWCVQTTHDEIAD